MKLIISLIFLIVVLLGLLFHSYWKLNACNDTLEQVKRSNSIIHKNFIDDTSDGYKQLNDYITILQSKPQSTEKTAFFELVGISMLDDELSKPERVDIRIAFVTALETSY